MFRFFEKLVSPYPQGAARLWAHQSGGFLGETEDSEEPIAIEAYGQNDR
jgi:hypothetical protein